MTTPLFLHRAIRALTIACALGVGLAGAAAAQTANRPDAAAPGAPPAAATTPHAATPGTARRNPTVSAPKTTRDVKDIRTRSSIAPAHRR